MSLSKDVKEYVDEAKALIGDVKIDHVHNDIDYYFNLTPEDIDKMDKEDCVQAQYFIMQYSISITKKINSLKAANAANIKEFNRALSQVYSSYSSFIGSAMIHASACSEHAHLQTMDNEITKLEALIQEYDNVPLKAEKLAEVFRGLSFCR
jgi:hypothetical protein